MAGSPTSSSPISLSTAVPFTSGNAPTTASSGGAPSNTNGSISLSTAVPFTSGNAPTGGPESSNLNVLNAPAANQPAGSNDQPGSLAQYADQSGNPASTSTNATPGFWAKTFAGTPFMPVQPAETSGQQGGTLEDSSNEGLKLMASGFANVVSDTPAAAAGLVNLIEPWKWPQIASSLIKGGAHITAAIARPITHAIETGDWSQVGKEEGLNLDKAEITTVNHPLQTVLAFDGGLEGLKSASDFASGVHAGITDPTNFNNTTDEAMKSYNNPMQALGERITNLRSNIAKLFANKTTLDEHTTQLGALTDQLVASTKAKADADNTVQSFNDQNKALQNQQAVLEAQLEQSKNDTQSEKESVQSQLETDLKTNNGQKTQAGFDLENGLKENTAQRTKAQEDLQAKLDENVKQQTALKEAQFKASKDLQTANDAKSAIVDQKESEVNSESQNQQHEMRINNGMSDDTTKITPESKLSDTVSKFFTKAYERASGVYDALKTNIKADPSEIIKGFEDYRDKSNENGLSGTAKRAQETIDYLKMRHIVNDENTSATPLSQDQIDTYKKLYGSDFNGSDLTPDTQSRLEQSGVNPKLWEGKTLAELKNLYKPITTENLKFLRGNLYDSIANTTNENSQREYNKNVEPAFKSTFDNLVRNTYGTDHLNNIKSADADWAELKQNPISKDPDPSLIKIKANWDSFVSAATKVEGGSEIVKQVQNFVAERIMNNAESNRIPGTFDYTKINSGLAKYDSMLNDTLRDRLQRISDDNKSVSDDRTQQVVEAKQTKQDLANNKKQENLDLQKQKQLSLKEPQERIKSLNAERPIIKETGEKNILKLNEEQGSIKEAATNTFKDLEGKQDEISKQQAALKDEQAGVKENLKTIGADKPDFAANVQKINSPEKLDSFLQKSGKPAEELGTVAILHSAESTWKELGANRTEPELDTKGKPVLDASGKPIVKTPNLDISKTKEFLDRIEKLGGTSQDVQDRLLGQTEEMAKNKELSDTQKQINTLRDKYDEWEKAKNIKQKTLAGRATKLALGTLMVTLAPIGKFYGFRQIVSALTPDSLSDEEINSRARVISPKGKTTGANELGLLQAGTIANTQERKNSNQKSP